MLRGIGDKEEMVKEMADVYYTLSMVMQEHGISCIEINKNIEFKQDRARKIMG